MTICACGCGKEIIYKPYHKWYGTPKYFSAIHANRAKKGIKTRKANFKGKHHTDAHKHNISLRFEKENNLKNLCFSFQVFPWSVTSNNYKLLKSLHNTDIITYRCLQTIASQQKRLQTRKYTPLSEDTKNKISASGTGKHTARGWKHSPETRKKNSDAKKGVLVGKKNGMYGVPPSPLANRGIRTWYDSPLQGQVCFRSSYELAYAKYLDSTHELWMYEIETFDLGDMTYTPDFYLLQKELFIEIKGYMTQYAQEKINQFREQYPWNLEILFGEDIKKLIL